MNDLTEEQEKYLDTNRRILEHGFKHREKGLDCCPIFLEKDEYENFNKQMRVSDLYLKHCEKSELIKPHESYTLATIYLGVPIMIPCDGK